MSIVTSMVSIKKMALALHVCCTCLTSPFHKVIQSKTVVVTCTSLPKLGAAPPRAQPQHLFSYIYTWLASGFTVSHSLYPPFSVSTYLTATDVVSIACFGRFLPFLYLEMTCCIVHTGEIRTLSENVTIEKVIYYMHI